MNDGHGTGTKGRRRRPTQRRWPKSDDFAALLKQNFKPRSERAASEVENAVQTLVTQALADSSLVKGDVIDTIEEMIARLDEKLSAQMNEILHAPEFQKLESAWRGLHYLVFNSETDATLKIRVMNVGKMELYRNLEALSRRALGPEPAVQEGLRAGIRQLGGEPYGALVADYHFSHSPVDVQLLRDLSKVASAALAPLRHRRRSEPAGHGFVDGADAIRAISAN